MCRHLCIAIFTLMISSCASNIIEPSNLSSSENLELCQQYIATYPELENQSATTMTETEAIAAVNMINEVRMRGLDEETCNRLVDESSY